MKNSNAGLPVVATSNGWTPIAFFDFASEYARHQAVLVWMVDPGGHDWFEVGRAENGSIVSEWRSVRHWRHSKIKQGSGVPVAFKLIEGPDIRELKRLHVRCACHFSLFVQRSRSVDGTCPEIVCSK